MHLKLLFIWLIYRHNTLMRLIARTMARWSVSVHFFAPKQALFPSTRVLLSFCSFASCDRTPINHILLDELCSHKKKLITKTNNSSDTLAIGPKGFARSRSDQIALCRRRCFPPPPPRLNGATFMLCSTPFTWASLGQQQIITKCITSSSVCWTATKLHVKWTHKRNGHRTETVLPEHGIGVSMTCTKSNHNLTAVAWKRLDPVEQK